MTVLTQERLKERLHYDPETGVFTWLYRPDGDKAWNNKMAGKVAGARDGKGYTHILVDQRFHRAHRLAWLYMTGDQPPAMIDHKDTDRTNNRWDNLRATTHFLNKGNRRKTRANTSGFKGVYWHRQRKRWTAGIGVDGAFKYLGLFDSPEEAAAAYAVAAEKHFGEFARVA
jgi:hypothetical protein